MRYNKPSYMLLPLLAIFSASMAWNGSFQSRPSLDALSADEDTTVSPVMRTAASEGDIPEMLTNDDVDAPEGFVPTMMTELQAADPASKIGIITPPAANSRGTASLAYALEMPPARNGMQPSVVVSYSSDGGSGWLGEGWDVHIPAITVDTRWGVPRYDTGNESETYLLDGQMLSFTGSDGKMHVAHRGAAEPRDTARQFFPRREGSFSTIIRHGASPSDYWWELTDNKGTRYVFGGTAGSQLYGTVTGSDGQVRTAIAEWHLSEVKEIHGDYIRYFYRHASEQVVQGLNSSALYLDRIEAGHAGFTSPHTVVTFTSTEGKTIRRNNARYGFLASSGELLSEVGVSFLGSPLRSYRFRYTDGAFGQRLLSAVVQCDNAGDSVGWHRFGYHQSAGMVNPSFGMTLFEPDSLWQPPTDNDGGFIRRLAALNTSHGRPTAIGGNSSTSSGGSAYVGINATDDMENDKGNTAGLSVSYDRNTSSGVSTLADINGDGLLDKVFVDDGLLRFRPQVVGSDGRRSFGPASTVYKNGGTASAFSKTTSYRLGGGAKAYIRAGSDVKAGLGADYSYGKSTTKVYLSDINADGLADLVENGKVWFNHLDDEGNIRFVNTSSLTPNPIGGDSPVDTTGIGADNAEEQTALVNSSPMQEIVREWTAPRTGRVSVVNSVRLLNATAEDEGTPDGIVAVMQYNGQVKRTISKTASNHNVTTSTTSFNVTRGGKIYFRLKCGNNILSNGSCDRVLWPVTITYTSGDTITDANGYNNRIFKSSQGNIESSRVQFPVPDGTTRVIVGGHFRKPVTTDDIQLRVYTTGNIDSSRTPSGLLTRYWNTAYNGTVNIPISSSAQLDYVECEVFSTSNVAWEDVKWIPEITFVSGADSTTMTIPALSHVYADERARGYVYSSSVRDTVYVIPYIPSGQSPHFTLTVKKRNTLVYKKVYPSQMANVPVIIEPNTPYYITISCDEANAALLGSQPMVSIGSQNVIMQWRDRNNSDTMSGGNPANESMAADELENLVRNAGTSTYANYDVYVDSLADTPSGPFWRGWGRYVHNAAYDRVSRVLATDSLRLPRSTEEAQTENWPYVRLGVAADGGILRWRGSKDDIFISGDTVSSARLAFNDVLPVHPLSEMLAQASGETVARPSLVLSENSLCLSGSRIQESSITISENTLEALIGSRQTANAATGSSHAVSTCIDMNGDGYPDILSRQHIQYTGMDGGLSSETVASSNQWTESSSGSLSLSSGGHPFYSGTVGRNPGSGARNDGLQQQSSQAARSKNLEAEAHMSGGMTFSGNRDSGNRTLIDMNGDGLPDLVEEDGTVSYNLGYSFASPIQLSGITALQQTNSHSANASGCVDIDLKATSFSAGVGGGITTSSELTAYLDVNGDGLPDRLLVDSSQVRVALNLGNSFSSDTVVDGLSCISASSSASASLNGSFSFSVHPFGVRITCTPEVHAATGFSRPTSDLRDIDGDGLPDLLSSDAENSLHVRRSAVGSTNLLASVSNSLGGSFSVGYTRSEATYDHPGGKWVMSSLTVDDGIHDDGPCPKTRFEYSDGVYDRREREFLGFGEVRTRQLDSGDGDTLYRTLTETFDVSSIHTQGLPLGTLVTDAQGRKFTETTNTYYTYDVTHTSSAPYVFTNATDLSDAAVAYTPRKFTETRQYEGTGSSVATHQEFCKYIVSGNSARGDLHYQYVSHQGTLQADGSGIYDYYKQMTYAHYASKKVYSRPSSVIVYYYGSTAQRHRVTCLWNSSCPVDLKTRIRYIASASTAVTTYTTDSHGNVTKVMLPSNASGQRMTYNYTYDNVMGMYPVTITDSHNYTSSTSYDYRYGIATLQVDFGGNKYHTLIDSLGRVVGVRGPKEMADTLAIRMEYTPVATVSGQDVTPAHAVTHYYNRRQGPDASGNVVPYYSDTRTVAFADGFGRVIQTRRDGVVTPVPTDLATPQPQHVFITSGRILYDAFGRVVSTYHPTSQPAAGNVLAGYVSTHDSEPPAVTAYDVLDRPVSVMLPDSACTLTDYSLADGLQRSVVTDPLGRRTATYADGAGRTMRTELLFGTDSVITTTYAYSAIGLLTSVTDHEGNATTYAYDMLGHRTQENHPASSLTNFTYDAAGNLTAKSTRNLQAKGMAVTYGYDFDHLTSVTYPEHPENNITYIYGTDGNSVDESTRANRLGRVILRVDGTGATEYFYDGMGNVTKEHRSLIVPNYKFTNGNVVVADFVTEYSYDSFGRLLSMKYPIQNTSVTYWYNRAGDLQKVTKGGTYGDCYVSHIGYDKFGRRTVEAYGDGTRATFGYDPLRLWMDTLRVEKGVTPIVSSSYGFDKVGNILSISNMNRHDEYSHDNLDRLVEAEGNTQNAAAGYSLSLSYDNLWRITGKHQHLFQYGVIPGAERRVGYDLSYHYQTLAARRHFQLGAVYDRTYHTSNPSGTPPATDIRHRYGYDLNGNIVYESMACINADSVHSERDHERRYLWDEENRLVATSENGYVSSYWYDADGNRTVKMHGAGTAAYVNGNRAAGQTDYDHYTVYASPYFSLTDDSRYACHVYMGGERIATMIGSLSSRFDDFESADKAGLGVTGASVPYALKYSQQVYAKKKAYGKLGVPYDGVVMDSIWNGADYALYAQLPDMESYGGDNTVIYPEDDLTGAEDDIEVIGDSRSDGSNSSGTDGESDEEPVAMLSMLYATSPTSTSTFYYHKDHLGSSSYITDGTGEVVQHVEYLPSGEVFLDEKNENWNTPYKFNGKELDEETGMYYYGARYYNPRLSLWLGTDPMQDKYPGISTYCYTMGNPVNSLDPDGRHTDVMFMKDNTYIVVGGQINDDLNIYVVNNERQRTGQVLGQSLTSYSFVRDNDDFAIGAKINMSDQSGQSFLSDFIENTPNLIYYMLNATGGRKYDFKQRGAIKNTPSYQSVEYNYRGMIVDVNGRESIASARDIGNYAAGYVAGINGFGWKESRLVFDGLESWQQRKWSKEGTPTQKAQFEGFRYGEQRFMEKSHVIVGDPYE